MRWVALQTSLLISRPLLRAFALTFFTSSQPSRLPSFVVSFYPAAIEGELKASSPYIETMKGDGCCMLKS